jgi:integrase
VVASYTRHNGFEKETKTGNPREVPVHPVLARLLKEWEERGFAELFGREPRADDLLIPNRHGGYRTDHTFGDIADDL